MTARVAILLAVVGCARASDDAPPAAEILHKAEQRYATAKTYWDRGEVGDTYSGRATRPEKTFATAYARSGRFRFEFREHGDPAAAYVIWVEGTTARTQWYVTPGEIREETLSDALAGATGVSSGVAWGVPELLGVVPGAPPRLTSLDDAKVDGPETIDGHSTWKVSGTQRGDVVSLWIDRESSAIRRSRRVNHVDAHGKSPAFDVDTVTSYDPHLDEAIANEQFAAPAPLVRPAWLGTPLAPTDLRIHRVVAGGPADRAGMRVGDTILSIDGHHEGSRRDVNAWLRASAPGRHVPFVVSREGQELTLDVQLAVRPTDSEVEGMVVGKPAAAFDLPAADGATRVRSRDLAGQVSVIAFCETQFLPCEDIWPKLDALQKRQGVHVIAISTEPAETVRAFTSSRHVGTTIAIDANEAVAGTYAVEHSPRVVVIDRTGTVRMSRMGVADGAAIDALVTELSK